MQLYEIDKHWLKLKKISKLTDQELRISSIRIFEKIQFINEELIAQKIWVKAEEIVRDIDIDDTDFVALTLYIKGTLWTGDEILHDGLKSNNFKSVANTSELAKIRENNTE